MIGILHTIEGKAYKFLVILMNLIRWSPGPQQMSVDLKKENFLEIPCSPLALPHHPYRQELVMDLSGSTIEYLNTTMT